jgi:hypothetical protein
VDDSTKAGLALNNHVWNAHLVTKSRKENDKLNGVNIMRGDNECCLSMRAVTWLRPYFV